MSTSSTAAGFGLDEQKGRLFLRRALRRHAGDLGEGEGDGAGPYESWALEPAWDLKEMFSDGAGHVEDLVYQAVHEAGVITCTAAGVDIELLTETPLEGDWMYQWRVSFPTGARFAICSPYREDLRRLGWYTATTKAKGCRTALGILYEAVASGNQLLAAYASAAGRVPLGSSGCALQQDQQAEPYASDLPVPGGYR